MIGLVSKLRGMPRARARRFDIIPAVSTLKPRLLQAAIVLLAFPFFAGSSEQVAYVPFADAKPILETLGNALPADLRDVSPEKLESLWPEWVKHRDAEIRERLAGGDADSVVNFLFFGASFTTEPRLTGAQLNAIAPAKTEDSPPGSDAAFQAIFAKRVLDLIHGMMAPGKNERLRFARKTLERAGIDFSDRNGQAGAERYLLENVRRVLQEQGAFQQAIATAKGLNDPTEEFVERSKLYRERGLSLDTSLPPDYALEEALKEMSARGLVKPGSVKRVGIIGPGLDFTDKQEGYDFYPTQTVQPFAVMDSLLRLGLANANEVEVDTLDLSPRVLEHVGQAKQAATKGQGYTIQLPRDPARGWKPGLVAYWQRFGDRIGSVAPPVAVPPGLKGIRLRAVRVRPQFVRRMRALDVNIVLQREEAPEDAKFDLLIATNILVYYDTFEQSLALANIQSMLRPGGFLLTNNLLLELPSSKMKSVDDVLVEYSPHEADGDQIVWYRREP